MWRVWWFTVPLLMGCQLLIGVEPRELVVGLDEDAGCTRNLDCQAFNDEHPDGDWVCARRSCVALNTGPCRVRSGAAWQRDDALLIVSLMTLQGAQATTNQARNNATILAVEELNRGGGVPWPNAEPRPLVHLSCDATSLQDAGRYLVHDLGVAAIIGPTFSQDVIDFTNQFSARGGVLVISPASQAGSISQLQDNDLTFRTLPSDVQRAPLLARRVTDLEDQLRDAGVTEPVRLAIVARNDSFGYGTVTALTQLQRLNGAAITAPSNVNAVLTEQYDPAMSSQSASVARLQAFRPHIVIGAGTAEVITQVVAPLEAGWSSARRPLYVFTDAAKGNDLLSLSNTSDAGLRERVSGIGLSPVSDSLAIEASFGQSYRAFFAPADGGAGSYPAVGGMGNAYDAVYALAYTIASQPDEPLTGAALATGLRRFGGTGARFDVGPRDIGRAFQAVTNKTPIRLQGTFGPIEFDANGDVLGSQIETWCVQTRVPPNALPSYGNAGQTFNTKSGTFAGSFTPCP
jgi:branched-chain amino acid transport system substrate-binding protein